MPDTKASTKKPATKKTSKAKPRMTLAEAMGELKKAGSEQTRKTYARHGADGPMFGVSFATLKALMKRIDVDHELALALWDTGNFDARNLAVKIVDPARMTPADLDRWARETSTSRMCGGYVGMLAAEGPHGAKKAAEWLESKDGRMRSAAWALLGQLTQRDETMPDAYFEKRLAEIERTIHTAPNAEREGMNMAVIMIGCRSRALRKAALAAAKRIGKVEIDHGDTACKTPDAAQYIEKCWAHATSKGFESPAAQERSRETPRRRC
ncbi:MAG TPA: DNA alkylation repair protein [Planctomycetota bacterium]|jgi:3-methyladenine DNA glycosylase AlkD|nr:DNA alkylation repair protein [Planctomycetota bacterium]